MFRFVVVCFLVSFIETLPSSKHHSVSFLKDISGRIINGKPAAPGQFPWQIDVRVANGQATRYWFCGASFISEEWALTSTHCIYEGYPGTTFLFAGSGEVLYTDDFIIHPGYVFDDEHLENDIALMHVISLDEPVVFNDTINAIALSSEELKAGTNVTISGWGGTNDTRNTKSGLNYVNLVTISNEDCAKVYGDFINSDMVCATSDTSEPKGFCEGDSGGPLVANLDSDPVLVGIASFVSSSGCESGLPSGYTRIANYRDWIKEKTGL